MNKNNKWKSVSWESPSNIALIKYWGKKENQIPLNPSISLTLKKSITQTKVLYRRKQSDIPTIELYTDNTRNIQFEIRIKQYIDRILPYSGFLSQTDLKIYTKNNFPHSTGIASSASGLSALALCFCSIDKTINERIEDKKAFYEKASFLSRLGSGSASRSVYGKYVFWGKSNIDMESQNEYALPISNVHPIFNIYQDSILIVDSSPKKLSSSNGHQLMDAHPFAEARYEQANKNYEALCNSLESLDRFILYLLEEKTNIIVNF